MLLQMNHRCQLCNVSNQDDPGPPKGDVLTLDSLWLHLFHQLSHCLVATSKPMAAVLSGPLNSVRDDSSSLKLPQSNDTRSCSANHSPSRRVNLACSWCSLLETISRSRTLQGQLMLHQLLCLLLR